MLRTLLRTKTSTPSNKAKTSLSRLSTLTTQAQAQAQKQQTKQILIKDIHVASDEDGMRLDRFLRHRLSQDPNRPAVNNNAILKSLKKRQIKLVIPFPTATTSPSTEMSPSSNDTLSEVKGNTGNIKDLVDKEQAKETTKTVTVAGTRIETGQTWRIRVMVETNLATESNGARASSGTSPLSHAAPIAPLSCLPLEDWVVYKDERIIVINKPSGIPVQGGTGVTTSIDSSLSVLQDGYPEKPRLVHRLDMTTSGLLVVARTRKAAQDLASRFHGGTNTVPDYNVEDSTSRIQKKYIAIVGSAQPVKEPSWTSQYVSESKTFRLQGDMLMTTDGKTQTIRMASSTVSKKSFTTKLVWPSTTDVTIAAQNYQSGTYWALLNLYPRTGRKHQLRVHCAQLLNAPILGDFKYSGVETKADDRTTPRIYLHMAGMVLKGWVASAASQEGMPPKGKSHWITKDGTLVVTATPEDDMQRTMKRLGLS